MSQSFVSGTYKYTVYSKQCGRLIHVAVVATNVTNYHIHNGAHSMWMIDLVIKKWFVSQCS